MAAASRPARFSSQQLQPGESALYAAAPQHASRVPSPPAGRPTCWKARAALASLAHWLLEDAETGRLDFGAEGTALRADGQLLRGLLRSVVDSQVHVFEACGSLGSSPEAASAAVHNLHIATCVVALAFEEARDVAAELVLAPAPGAAGGQQPAIVSRGAALAMAATAALRRLRKAWAAEARAAPAAAAQPAAARLAELASMALVALQLLPTVLTSDELRVARAARDPVTALWRTPERAAAARASIPLFLEGFSEAAACLHALADTPGVLPGGMLPCVGSADGLLSVSRGDVVAGARAALSQLGASAAGFSIPLSMLPPGWLAADVVGICRAAEAAMRLAPKIEPGRPGTPGIEAPSLCNAARIWLDAVKRIWPFEERGGEEHSGLGAGAPPADAAEAAAVFATVSAAKLARCVLAMPPVHQAALFRGTDDSGSSSSSSSRGLFEGCTLLTRALLLAAGLHQRAGTEASHPVLEG